MAGIGRLAKLLVKMGQKNLVRNFSKAPIKTTFKTIGKATIWPIKKVAQVHELYNTNLYKYSSIAAGTACAGSLAAGAYEGYQAEKTGDHKDYEDRSLKASKYIDTALGLLGGFILGGPIGALALGTAAYFTPKDLALGSDSVCKHGGKRITYNELRKLKEQEKQQKAEAEKPKETPEQPKVVTFESNEITQDELIQALKDAGIEVQEGDNVTINENTLTVKHKDGSEETAQVKIKNAPKAAENPSEIDQKILEILKAKNFEVKEGDKINVDLDKNEIQVTRGDKTHTIKADLTAIKAEVEAESKPEEKTDSTAVKQPTPVVPSDSTKVNTPAPVVPSDSTKVNTPTPVVPSDSTKVNSPTPVIPSDSTKINTPAPVVPNDSTKINNTAQDPNNAAQNPDTAPVAPANNLFNGEINEISKSSIKVDIKGDCLWNIAKRELQAANPGKTITNAQIRKQVIEFGRINPEIYGSNPSYKDLDNLQLGQELKLCA